MIKNDAISREREAIINAIYKMELSNWVKEDIEKMIQQLPSVQPKPIECDDAISREHLLSEVADLKRSPWFNHGKDDTDFQHAIYLERKEAVEMIEDICIKKEPSVSCRKGHWIEVAQYSDGKHKIECSECGNYIFDRGHANSHNVKEKYKYCNYCGAKMVEPKESEDK